MKRGLACALVALAARALFAQAAPSAPATEDLLRIADDLPGVRTAGPGRDRRRRGDPEGSTEWVLTLLHEHFHQHHMSLPDYFGSIERLDLARGDQTGMRPAILSELEDPDLTARKRVSFYAFGAGLALLLDQDGSAWKTRYMEEKLVLDM